MSFSGAYRRAADPTLPVGARFNAFIEVCSRFGGLSRLGMQPTYDALGQRFGFSRKRNPDEAQMAMALSVMVQARFRLVHLATQARFEKRRRKASRDRRKQPPPFTPEAVLRMLGEIGRRK